MVDSRKSAQAKQQRRNRDGTYADEGKTSSMPSGDILERFEQRQQTNTGDAPVETYEAGVKRMQELDQKLIDIANKEYEERKFGPDDEAYRVESGCMSARRSSRSCRNWIATGISHGATTAWMTTRMRGTILKEWKSLPESQRRMMMPKCI